ncbi:MAG: recombinase family protein [Prevotella sp.]|jgi:DNA invertase Pin-like site-specific DNA recombinase|nr:recombinase family protein [Prevotella sp.]
MNVIIYCRVSSDEQAKGGSLDFQEKALREYCRRNGHNIVDVYREDASGKDFEHRPEINKIMKYCKSHKQEVDLIIVLRWDRYSRNQRLAYINLDFFKSLSIEVNASEQYVDYFVPESKLQLAVYLSMAEVDNDKRSIGTMDGIHQTLSEGRCSNKAPRGYKNVKIDDYNKYVEIDKVKAPIIQWVFSEVAKGTQSPNYIRKLVEKKHNWKINKNSFMDMLRNRFYIAKVRVPEYKGIPEHYVDGKHDAIIDKVTFEKVQEIIDGKKKGLPKLSKKINPDLFLRKYICCPVCGKSITGATSSGNGGKYTYYNCSVDAKHFRCRTEEANELFAKYLSSLKPNEPILRLYKEVLKDIRQDGKLVFRSR